ncbi:MAG: hypothetical protein ACE5PO_07825 [Candidatus Bathyarchaeia archaeon]
MGGVGRGSNCSVEGCSDIAVRSISIEKAKSAGLQLSTAKRALLCQVHYKMLKKKLKKESMIEKWRRIG